MVNAGVAAWPRPYFRAGSQRTSIFFVCFAKTPLTDLPLSLAGFGLPDKELLGQIEVLEHSRAQSRSWFEDWWSGAFGVIARQDLGDELQLLTTSDTCFSLRADFEDRPDLAPLQSVWGLSRWLCARGASVVLDVHAFRFRTKDEVLSSSYDQSDVLRDVKLVFETQPTQAGLHLMHTRGLCKFARPELLCFLQPDDADAMGRVLNQISRTLMEGAGAEQIHLRVADGVELVTRTQAEPALVGSLGLQSAVVVARADGAPLAGIGRLVGA